MSRLAKFWNVRFGIYFCDNPILIPPQLRQITSLSSRDWRWFFPNNGVPLIVRSRGFLCMHSATHWVQLRWSFSTSRPPRLHSRDAPPSERYRSVLVGPFAKPVSWYRGITNAFNSNAAVWRGHWQWVDRGVDSERACVQADYTPLVKLLYYLLIHDINQHISQQ